MPFLTDEQYRLATKGGLHIGLKGVALLVVNIEQQIAMVRDPEFQRLYKIPYSEKRREVFPRSWVEEINGDLYGTVRFKNIRLDMTGKGGIVYQATGFSDLEAFYIQQLTKAKEGFYTKQVEHIQNKYYRRKKAA